MPMTLEGYLMSIRTGIFLVTALTLVIANAAYAQKVSKFDEGSTIMYNMEGETAYGMITPKGKAELMKTAKPLSNGVVIFRSGGKLYMAEDPGGKMYKAMGEYLGN
jgi:hypothetical protein